MGATIFHQYNALIAQLVERQFCKLDVVGSNPAGGTIHKEDYDSTRKDYYQDE